MLKTGLILGMALSANVALAGIFVAPDLTAHTGFYALTEPWVPAPVQTASNSIFSIRVLGLPSRDTARTYDVRPDRVAAAKADLDSLVNSESIDALDRVMAEKQIAACQRSRIKSCLVTLAYTQGSAFVTGSTGTTLWTNAHVLQSYLQTIEQQTGQKIADQLTKKSAVRIFLFNAAGALLFDPYVNTATIAVAPELTTAARQENSFYGYDSDYIALKLEKPIAPGIAAGEPTKNGYVVGYPHCTGCDVSDLIVPDFSAEDFKAALSDRSPYPNSDGHGPKVSTGTFFTFAQLQSFFDLTLEQVKDWHLNRMIFLNSDWTEENSGSPILNARGQVIAILTGGKSRRTHSGLEHVTRGVIPAQGFDFP